MKVAVFSTKPYDRAFLETTNKGYGHDLFFFEPRLTPQTCVMAADFPAVCVFVNDQLDSKTLATLSMQGTRLIALRCAGFNNVDVAAAHNLGMTVMRVPAYSPYSVAEHAVGLILALNRKIHRAYDRVREGNFALEGLLGFDLYGQTVGIVGTGKIGRIVAEIMKGFGCDILGYDPFPNPDFEALGGTYVSQSALYAQADIISLHSPLTPDTHHMINDEALSQMKDGVMLINTSRGALIDTQAAIEALKSGKLGYLGLDVYEEEADLFFEDLSNRVIHDDVFARLLMFPNVIVTGHQAFFTRNALERIAEVTLTNVSSFQQNIPSGNEVTLDLVQK